MTLTHSDRQRKQALERELRVPKTEYIVICAQAWCNASGYGIVHGWDGERFSDRAAAIKHGFKVRESDDFNIGVLVKGRLKSLDWMEKPIGETPETLKEIERELGLP